MVYAILGIYIILGFLIFTWVTAEWDTAGASVWINYIEVPMLIYSQRGRICKPAGMGKIYILISR